MRVAPTGRTSLLLHERGQRRELDGLDVVTLRQVPLRELGRNREAHSAAGDVDRRDESIERR